MPTDAPDPAPPDAKSPAGDWLPLFHAGDRACLERCYLDHFGMVYRAVGAVGSNADRETLVHEIF
jgi:hypothetical protein